MYVCTFTLVTIDEVAMETDAADKAPPPLAEPTKQLKVTYELYKKIANMLVHYLRGVEEATGVESGREREGNCKRSATLLVVSRCLLVATREGFCGHLCQLHTFRLSFG